VTMRSDRRSKTDGSDVSRRHSRWFDGYKPDFVSPPFFTE
jgi:hypothetical protein